MTRLQTEPWSTPYSMVILPRCVAPSQILTDNMDQSKIPTIHSCCSRSKLEFHSFFAIDRINWETPRSLYLDSGLFNLRSDLTSNIGYHVPDLIFPAAAMTDMTELTASEHLCPCLSERGRRVSGLFCPHCHRCYRVTIVTDESYKVTMAAPAQPRLRDSVTTL